MSLKYAKLRGRIVEKFGTQDAFRKKLGISKTAMSKKMTGKKKKKKKDISNWSKLLGIEPEQIGVYFFDV